VTPVFGEFIGPAGEHIAAAASFRGELPYRAQCGVVRQLDRLVATLARYLADLPLPDALDPGREPERYAEARAAPARLALERAARCLRPAAAGTADLDAGDIHPVVGHLAAAERYLTAGKDLLRTHFADGPAGPVTPRSYWAPVITSGPVTAALLSGLAGCTRDLGSWIVKLSAGGRVSAGVPSSALLALREAQPWLRLAATAIQAAQRVHHPPAALGLLYAIPVNTSPPRPPLEAGESVAELCERIPVTAERLRRAAFAFATRARWSPSATSLSWRRDALACAITGHASEMILRTLAKRASQVGLEPVFATQLLTAADDMTRAWKAWRAVTGQWDVVTTGAPRGTGLSPVAAEIGDLALRTGRLAYCNPHWTPACRDAALARHPADLAQTPADVVTVLAAVHHATDAVSRIAATDQEAVIAAAADNRVYVPVRLLSEKYDIPHPYTPAPQAHTAPLLAAYDTTAKAATRVTAALDDLAAAVDAPSSLLAAARQASLVLQPKLPARHEQGPSPQLPAVTPMPGQIEQALRQLQIRDSALLLRAAVIDQAARDLVSEATVKLSSRVTVTVPACPPAPAARQVPGEPARIARQGAPLTLHALPHADDRRGSASPILAQQSWPAREQTHGARTGL
jgi:hypothetical protein